MKGVIEGREQLIGELEALRRRVTELEKLERKWVRLERAMRASEEKYRSLVNNVRLGILRSTPGPPGRILEVNPALAEITGYSRDELLAMDMEELYTHREERQAFMEELPSAKGTVTRELHWRKKDGSKMVVLDTVITVRDDAGKVLYFDAIIEDITERKRMAEELSDKDERLETQNEELRNANDELQAADEELQATDAELQASNEELQATDAELRASNEELQATDAELRASNDELQAANEGLQQEIAERKRAEEKYASLVEQGNDGIIIIQDGLLRFANSKMVEITGFSLEETLGKPFANFVSLGDRRLVADRYRRRIAGEAVPSKYEIKILSESGKRIPVEVSGSSIEYEGRPADMAIIRDISERKRAERLIRESGERYRSLVNNVRLGILRSTPGPPGRILEVNPAFEEITGYFRDELLAMDMEELYIHPEERQALMEELTLAKGVVTRELHWRKKDGSEIVVLDTVITVRSKAGKVLHFDSIFEDITKRKQAERLLRESEERYRALVNLRGKFGAAIIMLQDTDQGEGVHTFVSDQWCHMTGYSREELLGMPFFDVVHPQDRVESMERHRRKMRGEAVPGLYELSLITKDGIEVPIELTSAYTVYQGKAANVAYIRDITERKQMEQHLIITDRLASVGELASGIAHELNNPLTSVIGFSQLVLDKEIPDDIKEDVRIISSEAQRAAGVVKNLLTFARKHAQVKELANINDIINKVLELRSYEQRVNNIRVETQFAADLPSVMADYFQLQQVFLNMVINAEHFMVEAHNKGTLTITTERVDRVVKAAFADDGPGIPEEDLGHVFDPFFTTKEVGKGTGLGLSICHGIITEHGGQIYAASELGKGATFIVELPIP